MVGNRLSYFCRAELPSDHGVAFWAGIRTRNLPRPPELGDSSKLSENPGGLRGQSVAALHDRNARGFRRRTRRMFAGLGLASPPFHKISPENDPSQHWKPRQAEPLPCRGVGNPREHGEFLGVKCLVQSPLFEDGFQPDALELEIVRHALGQAASKGEVRGVPCEPGVFRRHSTSADSWTSCRFTTFQSGGGRRVERTFFGKSTVLPLLRRNDECRLKPACMRS